MIRILLLPACLLLSSCGATQTLTRTLTTPLSVVRGLLSSAPALGSTAMSLGAMGAFMADEDRPLEAGKVPQAEDGETQPQQQPVERKRTRRGARLHGENAPASR